MYSKRHRQHCYLFYSPNKHRSLSISLFLPYLPCSPILNNLRFADFESQGTIIQNSPKWGHPIIYSYEFGSEWDSKWANKCVQQSAKAKWDVRSKRMSGMSGQVIGRASTLVLRILKSRFLLILIRSARFSDPVVRSYKVHRPPLPMPLRHMYLKKNPVILRNNQLNRSAFWFNWFFKGRSETERFRFFL